MIDARAVRSCPGRTELAVCKLLHKLARNVPRTQAIIELGAYQGRTTGWLAAGAERGKGATVWAVDPWDLRDPDDIPDQPVTIEPGYTDGRYRGSHDVFAEHLRAARIKNVRPIKGFAADVGRAWHGPPVGLLYHDARHLADAVEEDLAAWTSHTARAATVVLHDAANPQLGVVEGASRVLTEPVWAWDARRLRRWKKHPDRRGVLVVRKR